MLSTDMPYGGVDAQKQSKSSHSPENLAKPAVANGEQVLTGHVLIVDDDPHMARSIERVLNGRNIRTSIVHDGGSMLKLIYEDRPDVITLDLMLPGESGIDLLRMLRKSRHHQEIKIIAISALPKSKLEDALASGADEIFSKPFYNIELIDAVMRLLKVKPRS